MAKIKPLTGKFGDFSGIVLKAAASGNVEAVKHYLSVNPDWLNQVGPHGRTLLWEAAYKGRTQLVAELIQRGAEVNPWGSYYTPMLVELSAMAVAREAGRTELVELLESHGAVDDLYAACHRGDLEVINELLAVDPEAVDRPARDVPAHPRMGWHPIHYAVVGGQLAAVQLLVQHGAQVGEHLPLLLDWASDRENIIRYVQERAAAEGIQMSDEPACAKIPLIDRPDWLGFPPLVDACRGNHNAPDDPQRVLEILRQEANINITDHKGKTPLHRSSQAGFVKITRLLLDRGAKLDIADHNGCTPLFDAVHYGRTDVALILLKNGAPVDHADKRGETPLFAAGRRSQVESFSALLEFGADPSYTNHKGRTVADVVRGGRKKTPERAKIVAMLDSG